MATNPNMVAIQTVTVGAGGAAQIDFTNIPTTYTDLVIKYSLRGNGTNGVGLFYFNGDTTDANYSVRRVGTDGSTAFSNSYSAPYAAYMAKSSYTSSTFSNGEIYIPNYRGSTNKSFSVDDVTENNATAADLFLTAGIWNNTAAITAIRIKGVVDNFVQYSTATLYGVTSAGYGAKATGGTIYQDANYFYHSFTDTGTFTPSQNLTCDFVVVAGGGAGGGANSTGWISAGGGAGGYRTNTAVSFTNGTAYTVTIGGGGAGSSSGRGGSGSNSSIAGSGFSTFTSSGGGGGGSSGFTNSTQDGLGGGSGGGGAKSTTTIGNGGAGNAGSYSPVEGYAGGAGNNGGYGGGGGGSAGVGAAAVSDLNNPAAGGAGTANPYTAVNTMTLAAGGKAGGNPVDTVPSAGTANTGNGGQGVYANSAARAGAAGGSGLVIIRYAK